MLNLGMEKRDIKEYSFLKIINNRAMGKPLDGIEENCSGEISKKLNRAPMGTFIPGDVLQYRASTDLYKGSPTAGGDLVATNLLGASFIEILVASMQVKKLGAITLDNLVGNIEIPAQTGRTNASWIAENDNSTEAPATFGQIGMIPKTVTCSASFSRKLLLQSCISVEGFVKMDLARSIALAIDAACISGGSNGSPQGIIGGTSVGNVDMGDPDGATPTYAKMIEFIANLANSNALIGTAQGFLTNSNVSTKLMQTLKVPSSNFPVFVWEGNALEGVVAGFKAVVSNQVPSNLSKGGSSGILSAILFGCWDQLIIGEWSALDVLTDPFTLGSQGAVIVRCFSDIDLAIRHGACFATSVDVKTS